MSLLSSCYSCMFIVFPVFQAQSKGYDGPVLGPKIAEKNERGFSEEQVKASREGHIGMQAGTNKLASQSGQNFGLGRQIAGSGAQSDYDPYK